MASPSLETPAPKIFCGDCGGAYPAQELARFGDYYVCANCKPSYVQRMREGVQPIGRAVHYGGFWMRFLAIFIDGLILFAVTIPIRLMFGLGLGATIGSDPTNPDISKMFAGLGVVTLISVAIAVAYQGYFVSQKGGTPGKLALGLRIINAADGTNLSVGKAIGRYFAYLISAIILYIGYIMAAFDSEKRALHDHICSTRVIYK